MIACIKCFRSVDRVQSLHRINAKGIDGKFVCNECLPRHYPSIAFDLARDMVITNLIDAIREFNNKVKQ